MVTARDAMQVAYDTTVRSFGKDTEEAQLYGLRLGMALLGGWVGGWVGCCQSP